MTSESISVSVFWISRAQAAVRVKWNATRTRRVTPKFHGAVSVNLAAAVTRVGTEFSPLDES